jgi:membrane protein
MNLKSFWAKIESFPPWVAFVTWTKTHSFPGFARIPVYNIVDFIRDEMRKDAIITRANSMAFSFFLSLFPAVIVLFTILAYTPLYEQFSGALQEYILSVMPGNAGKMVFHTVEDIATKERKGLLSFGFILALWFSTNGMISMMKGFEKDHKTTFVIRNPIQKRLVAVKLTFLLAMILVGSVLLITLSNVLFKFIFKLVDIDWFTRVVLFVFKWLIVLLIFYSGITTIYREGGAMKRKLRFINPGAVLATVLSILTSLIFSFYVDNFNAYNKVYGSIGTLIVLLIWLQINCFILLAGFELNASIAVNRDRRREKGYH